MLQRVMLWNPWSAGPDYYQGKPVYVPEGWRVVGVYQSNLVLVADGDAEIPRNPLPPELTDADVARLVELSR